MFWTWSSCFATSTIFEFFISLLHSLCFTNSHFTNSSVGDFNTQRFTSVLSPSPLFTGHVLRFNASDNAVTNLFYNSILWKCMFYKVHFCFTSATFLRSFRFTIVTQTMFITVHVFAVYHLLLHVYHVLHMQCRFYTQLSFCTVDALQAGMDFLRGGAHPP